MHFHRTRRQLLHLARQRVIREGARHFQFHGETFRPAGSRLGVAGLSESRSISENCPEFGEHFCENLGKILAGKMGEASNLPSSPMFGHEDAARLGSRSRIRIVNAAPSERRLSAGAASTGRCRPSAAWPARSGAIAAQAALRFQVSNFTLRAPT